MKKNITKQTNTLCLAPMAALVFALVVALTMVATNLVGMATAHAAEVKVGSLMITDAWARGTPRSGGAFLTIHNLGAADELIDVRADLARKVQLHRTVSENGIMKMKHVSGLPVPAHGMATLKPGSYHVMMMGLNKPMKPGQTFPLTLVFKQAGEVTVQVDIMKMGATQGHDKGHKMDHKMDHKKEHKN
jgi:periplasmic copper chaperone A